MKTDIIDRDVLQLEEILHGFIGPYNSDLLDKTSMKGDSLIVYITLQRWNELSSELFLLQLRASNASRKIKKRLEQLERMQMAFDAWMRMLTIDERYVVKRHLIDGICWRQIQYEYCNKLRRNSPKSYSTLRRLQRSAIFKMVEYAHQN